MKKKILTILLACSMTAAAIPAAAYADETETVTAATEAEPAAEEEAPDVDVSKYLIITDDKYKNLEVSVPAKTEVTDADIDDEINQEISDAGLDAQEEGEVKDGDTVNIDFVGKKDGKAFDGGTASGMDLTIGSGTFIDGFESGLIGKKVGDTVDLNLTFPEDYGAADLAGQDVVFTVTINSIKKTPELTDELAEKVSGGESKTVDELREAVRKDLEEDNDLSYRQTLYSAIYQKLSETYKVDEYPQDFIDYYVNHSLEEMKAQAGAESESLDDMLKDYYGTDKDSMTDYLTTYAKQLLQQRIILGAVAAKENITLSEEDFQKALQGYADQYGMTADDLLTYYNEKDIRESELENKVMEYLEGVVKITEQEETEIDTEYIEIETEASVAETEG